MDDLVQKLRGEYGGDWREVSGTGGRYFVSNGGKIFSTPRRKSKGGLLRQWPRVGGYMTVCFRIEGRQRHALVHRIVAEAFIGPIPEGFEVRHIDGNPANNVLSNLCVGTRAENERDKERHGTLLRGERTPSAKLNWEQVCTIRMMKGLVKQADLAMRYGVARSTVQRIQSGQYWRHAS